jgi:hypothetical protein
MTRERRAQVGTWAGGGLLTAGAGVAWGVGYALIVAGLLVLLWFLTIYDVDDPDREV